MPGNMYAAGKVAGNGVIGIREIENIWRNFKIIVNPLCAFRLQIILHIILVGSENLFGSSQRIGVLLARGIAHAVLLKVEIKNRALGRRTAHYAHIIVNNSFHQRQQFEFFNRQEHSGAVMG